MDSLSARQSDTRADGNGAIIDLHQSDALHVTEDDGGFATGEKLDIQKRYKMDRVPLTSSSDSNKSTDKDMFSSDSKERQNRDMYKDISPSSDDEVMSSDSNRHRNREVNMNLSKPRGDDILSPGPKIGRYRHKDRDLHVSSSSDDEVLSSASNRHRNREVNMNLSQPRGDDILPPAPKIRRYRHKDRDLHVSSSSDDEVLSSDSNRQRNREVNLNLSQPTGDDILSPGPKIRRYRHKDRDLHVSSSSDDEVLSSASNRHRNREVNMNLSQPRGDDILPPAPKIRRYRHKDRDLHVNSSSDDDVRPSSPRARIHDRYANRDVSPSKWKHCDVEVANIPFDVDGLRLFSIKCSECEMMTKTKDGRNWGTWVTSSRKGFLGKRRIVRCKGSLTCMSPTCPYQEKYGSANRVQFERKRSIMQCFTCGTPAQNMYCNASKVWEYAYGSNKVSVMYIGSHTCLPKPPKISKEDIRTEVEKNPGAKPRQFVNDKMIEIMSAENFQWNAVEGVDEKFVDAKRIHNIREEIKAEKNPVGENFEGLAIYKGKCDQKDPYFIYKVNNRALNGKPSFVFKSSQEMAALAVEMDQESTGILREEFAYIDAKHNRCRGFKTLTLWTYHPVLRKLLCLAKMDVEEENTTNITEFWTLFNEMLQSYTSKADYQFNPFGIIADEHHANWNAMKNVFGEEMVKRSYSCEFHYKQSVHRHSRKLGACAGEFVEKANSMLHALTVADYESAYKNMSTFVTKHETLVNWLKWWNERRSHIFKAFKSSSAPASNLAEVGHAKMSSVGRSYMSLLESARHDVASAISQNDWSILPERRVVSYH